MPEPIHRWDRATALKALMWGAALAAAALLPAILSPWGHAGPESIWGWLAILLNLPGACVIWMIRAASGGFQSTTSVEGTLFSLYVIQTLIFGYIVFVRMRLKKRKINLESCQSGRPHNTSKLINARRLP